MILEKFFLKALENSKFFKSAHDFMHFYKKMAIKTEGSANFLHILYENHHISSKIRIFKKF